MQGPTLPPVVFASTPSAAVDIGQLVEVIDVGDQQLNVRASPGVIDVDIVFRAPEGSLFLVTEGPAQGDGLTWWRIEDPDDPQRVGWAAAEYLQVALIEETQP